MTIKIRFLCRNLIIDKMANKDSADQFYATINHAPCLSITPCQLSTFSSPISKTIRCKFCSQPWRAPLISVGRSPTLNALRHPSPPRRGEPTIPIVNNTCKIHRQDSIHPTHACLCWCSQQRQAFYFRAREGGLVWYACWWRTPWLLT